MTAYQKLPLAQHMNSFKDLNPRDRQDLDQYAIQLRDRISQFDQLLERYRGRLEGLEGLPEDLCADLEARSKQVEEIAGMIQDIQQRMVEGVQGANGTEQRNVLAALLRNKDAVDYAKIMHSRSGKKKDAVVFEGINARNVITLKSMPANAAFAENDLNRTAVTQPLSIIDLINWGTTDEAIHYFLRESAFDIMADIAPENTDKPESNLNFGLATMNVGTIAHWIRASKQVLADMTSLATYLEVRMAYGVRLKLEYYIVNGHTPATGEQKIFSGLLEEDNYVTITPEADATALDVLNQAKYKAAASFVLPDTMILNPEDWGKIERIKGADGHYIFGSPGAVIQPVLWGLPVVFAASMPKGKYWVGNIAIGFDGVIREDVSVTVSTEDGNNITKNLVTILAEMRATGAVVLPDACVAGDLPVIAPPTGG
ncbi:phage major capsid protein [Acinetobacter baumannii]